VEPSGRQELQDVAGGEPVAPGVDLLVGADHVVTVVTMSQARTSLLVIVWVLGITTVASLVAVRRNPSLAGHGVDLVDTQVTTDASPHTAPENPVPERDNATATPDRR
jgi:hypothetical protein